MKKTTERIISILLSIVMIFGTVTLGMTAFAEGEDTEECKHQNCEYTYDSSTQHMRICLDCGQTEPEKHDFDTETHKCSKCNYVYDCSKNGHLPDCVSFNDENHSMKCMACGYEWTETHSYDPSTKKCSACGHIFGGNCEEGQHYFVSDGGSSHTCAICGTTEGHTFNVFGNCIDCGYHDCNIYGHVFKGGFEYDDNYHWKVCDNCGIISSTGEDIENPDNKKADHKDDNKDGSCDICDFYVGHKWQLTGHSNPSCTEGGKNTYTCYICGESKEEDIAPLGHYWYDDTKVSDEDREYVDFEFSSNYESCTLTFKCRRPECGQTVSYTVYTTPTDNGAVLANKDTKRAIAKRVAPDCTNGSGLRYYAFFTVSGVLREMNLDISPAVVDPEHPENDRPGMMTIREYVALDSDLKDLVGANGENLDPKINADERGFVCMLTVPDGKEPALGHIYENKDYMRYQDDDGNWVEGPYYQPNGDASCTEDGTRTAPCDRCEKVSDTVPDVGSALGHDYDYDNPTKPATCEEDGLCVCSRCKEEVVLPALNHNWVKDDSKHVEATCTNEGSDTYVCSNCGKEKVETTPALPHNFDGTKAPIVTDPTCEGQGYTEKYCSTCEQYIKTDFTPALGHTPAEEPVKENITDPTCEKSGSYDSVIYCTVCGAELSRTKVSTPPTGHDFAYAPYDNDHHIATCRVCGYQAGRSYLHIDGDYDFKCDDCEAELKFWDHWLHYLVGLPTYGFGRSSEWFMNILMAIVHFFTGRMINF